MYYASFGILAILIHFIINFDVLKEPKNAAEFVGTKSYKRFLYSLLVYYVSDVLWGLLYEWGLTPLTYIDTVIYFTAMVLSLMLWTKFVVSYLHRSNTLCNILVYAGRATMLMEIVMLIVNLFVPVVFCFDENGVYCPGMARYITLAVQILLFTTVAVYSFIVAGKVTKNKRHYFMVGCSGMMMTVCIVLQTIFPLLPFYAVGCMLATCLIHSFIMQDIKADYNRELGIAQAKVYIDALTGIKNKAAYAETVLMLNRRIHDGSLKKLGVIVFDVNNLKEVNDQSGHEAGDRFIKDASQIICRQFEHSPVFRIGGDEFAAILEGKDYDNREALMQSFEEKIQQNIEADQVVIASGLAVYDPQTDSRFESVFERADTAMYANKRALKVNHA